MSLLGVKGFPTTLFTSHQGRSSNAQQLGHSLVAQPLHICCTITVFYETALPW